VASFCCFVEGCFPSPVVIGGIGVGFPCQSLHKFETPTCSQQTRGVFDAGRSVAMKRIESFCESICVRRLAPRPIEGK